MRRGFTLIEIMVVVVIIGLLMAVAAPMISARRDAAYVQRTQTVIDQLNSALTNYKSTYPTSTAYTGWDNGGVQAFASLKPFLAVPPNTSTISDFVGAYVLQYYTVSYGVPSGGSDVQFFATPNANATSTNDPQFIKLQ